MRTTVPFRLLTTMSKLSPMSAARLDNMQHTARLSARLRRSSACQRIEGPLIHLPNRAKRLDAAPHMPMPWVPWSSDGDGYASDRSFGGSV